MISRRTAIVGRGDGVAAGGARSRSVIKRQHDDRSYNRHEHAVRVEASNASSPRAVKMKPPTCRETFSGLVDDLAPDKSGDQAEYDPADN